MEIYSKHISILVILLIFNLTLCYGSNNTKCASKDTCSSCIQVPNCVWCGKKVKIREANPIRCFDKTINSEKTCPKDDIVDPKSSIQMFKNDDDTPQIQPRSAVLMLRVGEEIQIPITYQQAQDYPLDLYFLIDFSKWMKDYKNNLAKLTKELTQAMKKLSNNFHIGFGTFIDKPVLPYNEEIKPKCVLQKKCEPHYTYIHRMKLSNDWDYFKSKLEEIPTSTNYDDPEGGFDALMQAIVCQNEIGWRDKARKILIFLTDERYHLAGDGKLGGIIEPNDEKCHLDKDGRYSYDLIQDYPTAYQIRKQAEKNNINIIFSIKKDRVNDYSWFKKLAGSSVVECDLSGNSSKIIDIIKTHYEKLTTSVTLMDDASGNIEIKYFSNCTKNKEIQTNRCEFKGRPLIDFLIKIKVLQCPEDKSKWTQTINIFPKNLNESFMIDLNIICQCNCESNNIEYKSKSCNEKGTLKCGICLCDPERYGRTCECSRSDTLKDNTIEEINNCKPNEATNAICSNRGLCECGKCECIQRKNSEELIYGTFCECDNFTCPIYAMSICSGPENGICDCGECKCKSGWSGKACECKETNSTCIASGSDKVCSGNGKCECGQCKCIETNNFRYSGTYCQDCTNCPAQRCEEFKPCVECLIHQVEEHEKEECKLKCSSYKIEAMDLIENNETISNNDKMCRVPDNVGCTIIFKYRYIDDDENLEIYAQKTKECLKEINLIIIISSVVGTTVFAGILLLIIWKVCTTIHDAREYERFEQERKQAKFDSADNPLYRIPNTLTNNPTYRS